MLNKNEIYQTEITDITEDGSGVGRIDGMCVFVPKTAVGDICDVRIVKVLKSYAYGKLEKLITPSPDRCDSDCDVFGRCGGCTLRHMTYESELRLKESIVHNNLLRIGKLTDCKLLPIDATSASTRYRNKAQFPVAMNKNGLAVGFYAKHSHDVINTVDCALQPKLFSDIVALIRAFITENSISVYDESSHSGLLRHIFLRSSANCESISLCLVINGEKLPHCDKLISTVTSDFPQVKSICLNVNREKTNVIMGKKCITVHGDEHITDTLCGLKFNISPLSFYQVNHDGAELLYGKAAEFAELTGNETVLDLYCGAGTIGLSVAHKAKSVIGVEIIPQAIENAKQNALQNGITNAEFMCADASKAVTVLHQQGVKPDVIIVDPPRKGCDISVLTALVQFAPKRIVMVSCNSATLARDMAYLCENGYKAVKAQPVDMFPRTMHVEAVALLQRDINS